VIAGEELKDASFVTPEKGAYRKRTVHLAVSTKVAPII
jgi:hypothetical protein